MECYHLGSLLLQAAEGRVALGAFNIFNILSADAVIHAAGEFAHPVILQTSVSTVKRFGCEKLSRLINVLQEQARIPVLLHLDHCREAELAMRCIDAGWNSVMIDGSSLPLAQNIELTRSVVAYAHERGRDVEGELGTIAGTEEDIHATQGRGADYDQSLQFIGETGIDAFAPAIGTAHGIYHAKPELNYVLVERLAQNTSVPIVIHGGTGLDDVAFRKLVGCGASKINVSTALKVGYLDAWRTFSKGHEPCDPLALDAGAFDNIQKIVRRHLLAFYGEPQE